MEYEKIEEVLSEFKKKIAYLNSNANDLYKLIEKIEDDKNVSYFMWCLNFLSRGLDEITASVLFMELLVKDITRRLTMAKYTWDDIIIAPTSERAKKAVGKEVFYADTPLDCIEYANKNNIYYLGILDEIQEKCYPFLIRENSEWAFIIVKKEEPKKYVPFETLDEFIESYKKAEERIDYSNIEDYIASCGMWLRFNNDDVICAVTEIWADGVFLGHDHMKIKWEDLFNFYTFLNGAPCGKLVEVNDERLQAEKQIKRIKEENK